MALYDGKNFRGSIGNISFRKLDENTTTAQSNPGKGNVKQTANTKKSASLFGSLVSPFAKHIRFQFKSLVNNFADRKMVNRMNSAIAIIINQHLEPDGKIVFNVNSFNRLKGFEFNADSLLVDSLLCMPVVTYDDEKVHIAIPSFKVAKNIKFPANTDKVSIQIQPVFFKLNKGLGFRAQTQYLDFEKSFEMTASQTFSYDFKPGSICIIGLSLLFYHNRTTVNDKQFNPAGIFEASYKEGVSIDEDAKDWYPTGFSVEP